MGNLLWLLAIPPWIFLWTSLGVGYFKYMEARYSIWKMPWWHLPVWMAVGVPGLMAVVIGALTFGGWAFGAEFPWL